MHSLYDKVFVKYQAQGGVSTPTPHAYALGCWYLQLRKCTEKIKLLQDIFDIAEEEEDWIFVFVHPFLLT